MTQVDAIPRAFKERFQTLLGDEYTRFTESLFQPSTHFVRINTLKISVPKGLERLKELDITPNLLPWYAAGFRISGNHGQIPFTPEYSLGYFYIQEGASMLPAVILDPKPHHVVLDLCAAPGSKTTQLAQMMENQGAIIANDRSFRRLTSLGHNIQLCGVMNVITLCQDGRHLAQRIPLRFDRVLVDVPCTASGHLRSKPIQFHIPSPERISGIQTLQKGLLTSGFRLLKPGGQLVYSTCSLFPEENEAIIHHFLSRFPQAAIIRQSTPGLKVHNGVVEWNTQQFDDTITACLRVYPHDNDTDGFFIALIRKES
ncbi:MAG: RsmB/NOP family class I SAM-dependent RNA methyltransferase [Candidatus Odinarchaeota archaeon]